MKSWAISLTRRWNGSLRMRSSVLFWYLLISRRATVPGLYLWGFLTPPVAGADFLAALVASCFLGAFPPVDFLAVCLVRAMAIVQMKLMWDTGLTSLICAPCRQNRWRFVWGAQYFSRHFRTTLSPAAQHFTSQQRCPKFLIGCIKGYKPVQTPELTSFTDTSAT